MRGKVAYCLVVLLAAALTLPGEIQGSPAQGKKRTTVTRKVAAKKHSVKSHRRRSRRVRGQRAPEPQRIAEIQQALAKNGAYSGKPSGHWDAATVQAMKKFQLDQGLNPTGKMDAKSLQKLGLGSEIAGLAAPLPLAGAPAGEAESSRNQR